MIETELAHEESPVQRQASTHKDENTCGDGTEVVRTARNAENAGGDLCTVLVIYA